MYFLNFILMLVGFGFAQHQSMIPVNTLLSEKVNIGFQVGIDMIGGDSVGGGDSVDVRRSTAWFYGNGSIQVCYQLSVNFGLTASEVEGALVESTTVWKNYFVQKQLISGIEASQLINTNFNLKKNCEGGEDLVLYLGTGPVFGNLDDLRARQYLSRPVAYVNKTHMSEDMKWSKGYIRFVEPGSYLADNGLFFPDWNLGSSFYNMLLHEFGHILGFDHVPNSIMAKDLSRNLFIDGNSTDKMKIDGSEELIICKNCAKTYLAKTNFANIERIERKQEELLRIVQSGNLKDVNINHVIYQKSQVNLITNFGLNTYSESRPSVYFIEVDGNHYTLELANKELLLRRNGTLMATFVEEETL